MTESEVKTVKLLYDLVRVLLDDAWGADEYSLRSSLRELAQRMEKEFDEGVLGIEKGIEI